MRIEWNREKDRVNQATKKERHLYEQTHKKTKN